MLPLLILVPCLVFVADSAESSATTSPVYVPKHESSKPEGLPVTFKNKSWIFYVSTSSGAEGYFVYQEGSPIEFKIMLPDLKELDKETELKFLLGETDNFTLGVTNDEESTRYYLDGKHLFAEEGNMHKIEIFDNKTLIISSESGYGKENLKTFPKPIKIDEKTMAIHFKIIGNNTKPIQFIFEIGKIGFDSTLCPKTTWVSEDDSAKELDGYVLFLSLGGGVILIGIIVSIIVYATDKPKKGPPPPANNTVVQSAPAAASGTNV